MQDEAARQTWQTQVDVLEMLVGVTEGDLMGQQAELALCEAMVAEIEADLAAEDTSASVVQESQPPLLSMAQ